MAKCSAFVKFLFLLGSDETAFSVVYGPLTCPYNRIQSYSAH